jgi:hypothetical protein
LKLGIFYKIAPFGAHTWATIFGNLKHLLVRKKIELIGDATLIPQFRNLREEKTERSQIDIRPIGRARDDLAVAVALAANELTKEVSAPAPFELQFLLNQSEAGTHLRELRQKDAIPPYPEK